jgi:hypothetical protein
MQINSFDILAHIDNLKPDGGKNSPKGDHSFHCPVCGANNFKVNVATGKYIAASCNCLDTPEGKQRVIDAISPPIKKARPKSEVYYGYPDRAGNPYVRVKRVDDGTGRKNFYQQHWNGQRWVNGLGNLDRASIPVYRYAEVRAAIEQGCHIFVAEGESAVDALWAIGLAATCNIGGSGKWRDSDSADLSGANVVICPDRDMPGVKHAAEIGESFPQAQWLYAVPQSQYWEPNKLPATGGLDVKDWIEDDRATRDDIIAAIEPSARFVPAEAKPLSKADELRLEIQAVLAEKDPVERALMKSKLCPRYSMSKGELNDLIAQVAARATRSSAAKPLTMAEVLALESSALRWLVPGLLPAAETVLLNALPKVGKTLLSVDLAFAVATGGRFLGEQCQQGSVLMISADESLRSTRSKLLNRGFRADDPIHVLSDWDIGKLDELETMLDEIRPALVIVDSLKRITVGRDISENSAEFADCIYQLKELLGRYNAAGLLIHHANKDKEAIGVGKVRGSTAISGAVWGTWLLNHASGGSDFDPRDPNRILECICRDAEGAKLRISLNPEDFSFAAQYDEQAIAAKSQLDQLIELLQVHPNGLQVAEIKHLYPHIANPGVVLSRGVSKGLLSQQPAKTGRGSVFSLPTPLPPPYSVSPRPVISVNESFTEQEIQQNNIQNNKPITTNNTAVIDTPCYSDVINDVILPEASDGKAFIDSITTVVGDTQGGGVEVGSSNRAILNKPVAIKEAAGITNKAGFAMTWVVSAVDGDSYKLRLNGTSERKTVLISSIAPDHIIW